MRCTTPRDRREKDGGRTPSSCLPPLSHGRIVTPVNRTRFEVFGFDRHRCPRVVGLGPNAAGVCRAPPRRADQAMPGQGFPGGRSRCPRKLKSRTASRCFSTSLWRPSAAAATGRIPRSRTARATRTGTPAVRVHRLAGGSRLRRRLSVEYRIGAGGGRANRDRGLPDAEPVPDDAIASAVTEFGRASRPSQVDGRGDPEHHRLGFFAMSCGIW
jgi:hypothetical protein